MAPSPILSSSYPSRMMHAFAKRDLCEDRYGNYYTCSGFSNGARAGVGIAIAAAILIIIAIVLCLGRRRRQRVQNSTQAYGYSGPGPNQAAYGTPYTGNPYTAQQPEQPYYYGSQPGGETMQGGANNASYGYPPQANTGNTNYAPPPGPPPAAESPYAPPSQPPPSYQKE